MTRSARHIAVAGIAALIALAAIVAADIAAPAPTQAQSDEQSSGKIIARRIADDRIEFGWQTPSGARVFPRQRYFPASATVDRWLRSSPVIVADAEIGRINARLLSDGRIEFGFTPTDGERIEPRARYFPTNARVGHWLRSTEITITPVAPSYTAVSAGGDHICAIRESNSAIECWGDNEYGQTDAPGGRYIAVSTDEWHTCAIRESGEIECWGLNGWVQGRRGTNEETVHPVIETALLDVSPGNYTAVSIDRSHTCAIHTSGAVECWGDNWHRQGEAPGGNYTAVSAGSLHTCAIRAGDGAIECWGLNNGGQTDAPDGSFTAVSAGNSHTCAIRAGDGAIECWGLNNGGQTDAPDGSYAAVSAGWEHTCAIHDTGEIECWGGNREGSTSGETDAPPGSYIAVSAAPFYNCAIRENGEIVCWGLNAYDLIVNVSHIQYHH